MRLTTPTALLASGVLIAAALYFGLVSLSQPYDDFIYNDQTGAGITRIRKSTGDVERYERVGNGEFSWVRLGSGR